MRKNRFLTRLAAGALVVAVAAGGALLIGGMANAAPPPGDGPLTLLPATGIAETVPTLDTPAPCPETADAYVVRVDGPDDFDSVITSNQSAGISFTEPFQTQFGNSMLVISQLVGKPIVPGEYDIFMDCIDSFEGTVFRTFTTAMYFTSPTEYTTTDPAGGTPSPSVEPSPSASPGPGGEPLDRIITKVMAALQRIVQFLQLLTQFVHGGLQLDFGS